MPLEHTSPGVATALEPDLRHDFRPRRILVATDFSDHATNGLQHAIGLADVYSSSIHVLSVIVIHDSSADPAEREVENLVDRARVDSIPELERWTGPSTTSVREAPAAAPAILEYAQEEDVDLIVMGSRGLRGIRRLLLGSVTEEVIRESRWPVLTVHEAERAVLPYRTILAPVDFSSRTTRQIDVAADIAEHFGATLELLHSVDPPTVPDLYVPVGAAATDLGAIMTNVASRLEELTATLPASLDATTSVLVGSAAAEIARHAKGRADLIVMPTHGHSGLDRILLGSTAEGVLRRVDCPVLVLTGDRIDDGRIPENRDRA